MRRKQVLTQLYNRKSETQSEKLTFPRLQPKCNYWELNFASFIDASWKTEFLASGKCCLCISIDSRGVTSTYSIHRPDHSELSILYEFTGNWQDKIMLPHPSYPNKVGWCGSIGLISNRKDTSAPIHIIVGKKPKEYRIGFARYWGTYLIPMHSIPSPYLGIPFCGPQHQGFSGFKKKQQTTTRTGIWGLVWVVWGQMLLQQAAITGLTKLIVLPRTTHTPPVLAFPVG